MSSIDLPSYAIPHLVNHEVRWVATCRRLVTFPWYSTKATNLAAWSAVEHQAQKAWLGDL